MVRLLGSRLSFKALRGPGMPSSLPWGPKWVAVKSMIPFGVP